MSGAVRTLEPQLRVVDNHVRWWSAAITDRYRVEFTRIVTPRIEDVVNRVPNPLGGEVLLD